MTTPSLDAWRHRHAGRPGVVMGGGPSLPAEMARAPAGAVLLSVNHHGALLRPCDYTTAYDMSVIERLAPLRPHRTGVVLTPFVNHTDALLVADMPKVTHLSAVATVWIALYLGCAPVWLAGFDCFGNADAATRPYWHDQAAHEGTEIKLGTGGVAGELRRWREGAKRLPRRDLVRALGGPLVEIFGGPET